ncbi:unnamed protein product [Closterium sp. Naga37s-1]|nr:unnamed protein product [Closterium sp. Naga37s-1]
MAGSERLRALLRINNFRDELRALRHHFLGTRELRVVTATWNVAGISDPPAHLDLTDWLSLQQPADIIAIGWVVFTIGCLLFHTLELPCHVCGMCFHAPAAHLDLTDWLSLQQPADIISIGFQEIVPLSTGSVLGMDSEEAIPALSFVCSSLPVPPCALLICSFQEIVPLSTGSVLGMDSEEAIPALSFVCSSLPVPPCALLICSFQEIVPLSTGSVLGMDSEEAVGQWDALVRRQLNTAAAKAAKKAAAKAAGSAASRDSSKADEPIEGVVDGAEQAVTEGGSRAGDDETSSVSSSSGVQGRATPPPSLTSSSDLSFHTSSFRLPSSASDAPKGSLDESSAAAAAAAASMSPADSSAAAPATPEWEGDALQQGDHADKAPLDKILPEDLISVPLTPAEPIFADGGGYGGEGGGDGGEERGDVQASEGGVVGGKSGEGEGAGVDGATGGEEEGRGGEMEEEWEGGEVEEAYVKVAGRQMVGVYLMVWARKGLRRHIHSVKASTVGCGLMGILGNKGSVAISMSVHETSFTFICAHLNAGEERADAARRTFDFLEILRRTAFPRELPDPWTARLAETITEHDRVFFFGDLNYRLELPDLEARALLAKRDWEALLQHDQLRWELSEGGALPGWREGPIFFAPTYKYAAGSNRYVGEDEEDGEKRRTPAWCDRVLWYDSGDATDSLPPTSISSPSPSTTTTTTGIASSGSMSSMGGYASDALQLVSYSRAELALSDHRPVAAVFAVQVEAVERERFDAAVAVACRQLDERQQLAIPHFSLSAHAVEFGEVPYASVIRRTIELHNLGTVPARFSVAPAGSTDTAAPGPAGGCGAWVVAEPAAGAVAPGHTVTLSLHTWVAVPGTRVDLLVDRGGLLDLILVVAIAGGGDLFVACSGSYVPSCWGLRLEALAGLKDPIRSLSLDAIATRQRSSLRYSRATAASAAGGHQASIPEASEADPDNDDSNDSAAAGGEDDRPLGAAARAAAPHASDAFEVPKEVARMLTFLLDSGQDISSAFDPIALGIDLSLDQDDSSRAPPFPSSHSTPHGHPHSLSHARSATAGAVGAAAADLAAGGAMAAGGGGGGAGAGAGEGDGPGSTQFLAAKAAALGAVAQELQIAPIRLALDTGTPFPTETSPLTMARALVSFLLALPEPIIPPSVGDEVACREGWARGAAATLLAKRLGAVQLGVVDSLLALIQALLRNRIANRLAIHELEPLSVSVVFNMTYVCIFVVLLAAAILAYCLFGPVPAFTNDEMGIATATDAVRIVKRRRRFMRLLIEDTRLRSK